MKRFMLLFVLLLLPALALAADKPAIYLSAGANAVWFDENSKPSDFELGTTAALSGSANLAAVGSVFFGLDNSYARATAGFRITASDANDKNFSVGLGMVYQFSSESVRPQEWTPDVTIGWAPVPELLPKLIIGGEAGYGLTSKTAFVMASARYPIGSF